MSGGLDEYGLNAARLIAGFGGGVVHIFGARRFEPVRAAGSIVAGTVTANYLGPAATHYAPSWVGEFGAAFLVGYFALLILQGIGELLTWRLRGAVREAKRDEL